MPTLDDILTAMSTTGSDTPRRSAPASPETKADRTTRAAREIIEEETRTRNEARDRLKAARLARARGETDSGAGGKSEG